MKIKGAIIATGTLAAFWGALGYVGWTWIPIGKRAKQGQIKVACVGDSITYGAMITNWFAHNYPHVLQKYVGEEYCVHNYGMSGRTGMDTGDHPYRKELRYKRSLRFRPDIVILMFGTNDSKPQNWRGKEEFKRQYREMIESYLDQKNNPRVILLQPPAPHHKDGTEGDIYAFDIQNSKVLEVGEAVQKLVEEMGLVTLDLYTFTVDYPEWFVADGIHPNAQGAEQIAQLLSKTFSKTVE